jgi:hypothetical protein
VDRCAADDLSALRADVVGERAGDPGEVDAGGMGRVQRRDAGGVRLDGPQARRVEPAQPRHPVGGSTALELVERGQLAPVERHDQLPAALICHAPRLAVLGQLRGSRDAQPRLERAGGVVDAGVRHAGVVARLVQRRPRLAFEHDDSLPGMPAAELARDGQPEDPRADHRDPRLVHSGANRRDGPRCRRRP